MTARPHAEKLARTMGLFDATMIVMGGVVGVGIFMNPSVVAGHLHSAALILGAWIAGGIVALLASAGFYQIVSMFMNVDRLPMANASQNPELKYMAKPLPR